MEFIRTIRQKYEARQHSDIRHQAEELITLSDFADELYVAYNGVPLVPIDPKWTSKDILEELTKLRSNYINSKTRSHS